MNKSLFLLGSWFTFLTVFEGQASSTGQSTDLGEKPSAVKRTVITLPPFDHQLVPAELPFINYCKETTIKVNWEVARISFLGMVTYDYSDFRYRVKDRLHIAYDKLDKLGVQKLYEQYKDFYNNWFGLTSEQKENEKPVVSMASSCSSSSSSSSSTSTISSTAVEDDADAISSVTPLLLRQRHPTSSSSTLEVK